MNVRRRVAACGLAILLGLLVAVPYATAAPRPISGKLSRSGYTVIALAANGKATTAPTRRGRFRIRPPASRVTLHLRVRDGTYAGPIVLESRRRGRRATVGVRHGARLGRISVRRGYARASKRVSRRSIDRRRVARARRGIPIGAKVFGRVRSTRTGRGAPGDRDLDGIPEPLDIDDDGDLILDNLDRDTRRARAAQTPRDFVIHTSLVLPIQDTVNVNAGSTDEQLDLALTGSGRSERGGRLHVEIVPGDAVELDCGGTANPAPPPPRTGGLSYCSSGGTGGIFTPGSDTLTPFPDCCDADRDGYGTISDPFGFFTFAHRATAEQIQTGDVLVQRATRSGVESQFASTVQYVFVTAPALVSYSDTMGNAGTLTYPASADQAMPVAAGPDGRVVLTLTLWRPQRRRIESDPPPTAGQSDSWTDIGGLAYEVRISNVEGFGGSGDQCPQGAFSTTDPNLTPSPPVGTTAGGFTDQSADRPASAASTLTYTVDVTACLPPGVTWDPGRTVGLDLVARTSTLEHTLQGGVPFRRQ